MANLPPIYLDYNATTPLCPEARAAMAEHLGEDTHMVHMGNPSSSHGYGAAAAGDVAAARANLATLVGAASPDSIVFTSGGTESNNWAIKGLVPHLVATGKTTIVTSAVEHPAITVVLDAVAAAEPAIRIVTLPVDAHGVLRWEPFAETLESGNVGLVSIMMANNEVGALAPVARMGAAAAAAGALFHTDASQAVGKVPIDVVQMGIDLLTVAGHKLYAPKGVGCLYISPETAAAPLQPFIHGASHEAGRRAGTESTLLIAGLGAAAAAATANFDDRVAHMAATRDALWRELQDRVPPGAVIANTDVKTPGAALPNTLSVAFKGVVASRLLARVASEVAASAGAACHSSSEDADADTDAAPAVSVSKVIQAMGVDPDYAAGTIRFSTGMYTTPAHVERAAVVFAEAYAAELA